MLLMISCQSQQDDVLYFDFFKEATKNISIRSLGYINQKIVLSIEDANNYEKNHLIGFLFVEKQKKHVYDIKFLKNQLSSCVWQGDILIKIDENPKIFFYHNQQHRNQYNIWDHAKYLTSVDSMSKTIYQIYLVVKIENHLYLHFYRDFSPPKQIDTIDITSTLYTTKNCYQLYLEDILSKNIEKILLSESSAFDIHALLKKNDEKNWIQMMPPLESKTPWTLSISQNSVLLQSSQSAKDRKDSSVSIDDFF